MLNAKWKDESPDKDWTRLQLEAAFLHPRRVTVRTATGQASGTPRAAEPDRLILGDRASKPEIVARTEICQVFASTHVFTPRTEIISTAIGGGSTMKQPAGVLYSNPDAGRSAD